MRRAALLVAGAAVVGITATACSQVAAVAPVGGGRLTDVRFAGNDVLTGKNVAVLAAPVCTQAADRAVTCTGSTVDGKPIQVSSTATDQQTMTVTVGGETIFTGAIQDVLDAGARPAS